jgi:aminopeptidase
MNIYEKYAELIIKVGINLKAGKEVVIVAPVAASEFVRILAKKAYEAGAKRVIDAYNDEELLKLYLENADNETLEEFLAWRIDGIVSHLKDGASVINLMMPNPKLLEAISPEKLQIHQKTTSKGNLKLYELTMTGKSKWVIVALPSPAWAKQIFPDHEEEAAIEKLWNHLIKINRLDHEDPVHAWENHLSVLDDKLKWLNDKKLVKLVYEAPGTDLTIELPEGHVWLGGSHCSVDGEEFLPNIPTEEVFTLPHKYKVNGTVRSTMPLNQSGNLIEDFSITFESGKVVDYNALKGKEILTNILSIDEGANYLGEVALVPYTSPISQTGIVFYNTLYDENASCHLALGTAYGLCHEKNSELDDEGKDQAGINKSLMHVDFMVGSNELNITGYDQAGNSYPVFIKGEWGI